MIRGLISVHACAFSLTAEAVQFTDHWCVGVNEAEGFRQACEMLQIPAGAWIYVWMRICMSIQAKQRGSFGYHNLK